MAEKSNHSFRIDKVAGEFQVWLDDSFPFAKMKVKVLERSSGDFLAVPNLFVLDPLSQEPVYISGLAGSASEALDDLLTRFVANVRENTPPGGLTETSFVWSAHEDF